MTLRERVIVEVYTGVCMTSPEERNEVYKYMAQIMGREVYTHELANTRIQEQLQEKSRPDFIKLCKTNEVEVAGDLISRKALLNEIDSQISEIEKDDPHDVDLSTTFTKRVAFHIKNLINRMPCAYDTNKVTEQVLDTYFHCATSNCTTCSENRLSGVTCLSALRKSLRGG